MTCLGDVVGHAADRRDGYFGEARIDLARLFASARKIGNGQLIRRWYDVRFSSQLAAASAHTDDDVLDPRLTPQNVDDPIGDRVVLLLVERQDEAVLTRPGEKDVLLLVLSSANAD